MSNAKRLIAYLENVVDLNIGTLRGLVNDCKESEQLDATFEGVTPLSVACSTECEPAVKLLLKAGASVDLLTGYFEKSPLHYCVDFHAEEIVICCAIAKLLLENGANVNQLDTNHWTPLHYACQSSNEGCVDLFIGYGANLNAVDLDLETPLIKACKTCSHDIIEKLVNAGCDINHGYGTALRTLLKNQGVAFKSVKLLMEKGANLKLQNYLCIACCNTNRPDIIAYLITKGANVNDRGNILNITALHQACISTKPSYEIVEMLLQHDADINAVSDTGDSALHYACQAVNLEKMLVLLNWGADLNHIDDCKFTPLGALLTTRVDEGLFGDYMKIANVLLAAGATLTDQEFESLQKEIPVPLSPSETEKSIACFLANLQERCRLPARLIDICRIQVRSCIGGKKDTKVKDLFLPKYLKEFLFFSDIV